MVVIDGIECFVEGDELLALHDGNTYSVKPTLGAEEISFLLQLAAEKQLATAKFDARNVIIEIQNILGYEKLSFSLAKIDSSVPKSLKATARIDCKGNQYNVGYFATSAEFNARMLKWLKYCGARSLDLTEKELDQAKTIDELNKMLKTKMASGLSLAFYSVSDSIIHIRGHDSPTIFSTKPGAPSTFWFSNASYTREEFEKAIARPNVFHHAQHIIESGEFFHVFY